MSSGSPYGLFVQMPGEQALFGFLHPAQGTLSRVAVLLCPPFGWEEVGSYRSRRTWANQLSGEGITTMRIDLPGTGDSSGDAWTADLTDAWASAISTSSRWLRAETGCERLVAIGLGLGGQMALLAAARDAPIDDLILWSVPRSGRTLIRELRAFARFETIRLEEEGAEVADLPEGALHAGGYTMAPATTASLEQLDLTSLELPEADSRRALLLGRDDARADEKLRVALSEQGVDVEEEPGPGYGAMTAEPQRSRPSTEVFATVAAWLAASPGPRDRQQGTLEAPPAGPTAVIPVGDHTVKESAIVFEEPFGELFGVLTEPLGTAPESCVVLLNAGGQRHTGPNRMWVEAARRWAGSGIACLRLDVEGIGDSDGEDEDFSDDARFYVDAYIEQIRHVLDRLVERGLPASFQLIGLCSGAYWSLRTAVVDDRVFAVGMLNPRALVFRASLEAEREARKVQKLTKAATWRRVLRRETSLRRPLIIARATLGRALHAAVAKLRRRWLGGAASKDELDELFDRLRDLGKSGLLVFSGAEPLDYEFAREGRLERLGDWPNLELVRIGSSAETHTLQPLSIQAEAYALLDRTVGLGSTRDAQRAQPLS
jgi:alpha/beta superfamily hydrolase